MNHPRVIALCALSLLVSDLPVRAFPAAAPSAPEPGVPRTVAEERSERISDIRYELFYRVEEGREIEGTVHIDFYLESAGEPLVLDFAGERVERVSRSVHARGGSTGSAPEEAVAFVFEKEHIIVPLQYLEVGRNRLVIDFTPDERPFHRERSYLYSLFVPDRARYAFPCFDQPDLKARYVLTLEIPGGWVAVSNTSVRAHEERGEQQGTVVRFSETEPLSTYLFSFAAGRFAVETGERDGRVMNLYHLEPDTAKLHRNVNAIFDLHGEALRWMEEYTGIEYPFGKFDFLALPGFSYSGMEHPGAILYRAERLFLEESATEMDRLRRASVVSHETAHMWFGDLVTMRWFDDVWLKEAFAQFMADRIIRPAFPGVDHRLLFVSSHCDPLSDVERTAGTNPIRQELDNLNEAGSVYGDIIYHKPPVMLNQLEALIGDRPFRQALGEYLRAYRYGNATWEELVAVLDRHCTEDLAEWSETWVMERGRPAISMNLVRDHAGEQNAHGTSGAVDGAGDGASNARLVIRQDDPLGRGLSWTQRYTVAVCTPEGIREIPVLLDSHEIAVEAGVPENAFILPDSRGDGFGHFEVDWSGLASFDLGVERMLDPVQRAMLARHARDDFLEGALGDAYIGLIHSLFASEDVELNVQAELKYLVEAYWLFMTDERREAWAPALEDSILEKIRKVFSASAKSACFQAFRSVATTDRGVETLRKVWEGDITFVGLPFSERDFCDMALELAVREVPGWREILERQGARIEDPELARRYAFVRQAVDSGRAQRERFFVSLAKAENRRHEPWVLEALYYFHHPRRIASAVRYIPRSLELLEEIRATGDIFFPRDWITATLRYHRSDEALRSVAGFLGARPDYPSKLVSIVLQAADIPTRANRIRL
jgi:aminopeptidase N